MSHSESGRGGRARGSGRARSRQPRPPARRPRTRCVPSAEPAVAVLETPDEPVAVQHSEDLERLPAEPPAPSLVARLGNRIASVNSRRAVVFLGVVVVLVLILAVPMRTYLGQRSEYNRLQAQNAELAQEIDELTRKVNQQNDPAYIEQQARERLQYKKPGEKLVVLRFPERDRQAQQEQRAREHAARPWYDNLWDAVSTPPEDQ